VVGILFTAFVVARIVSLAASGGGRPFALKDLALVRRAGRFELLVAAGLLGLLTAPFPDPVGAGAVLLDVAATALLLSALYAASESTFGRTLAFAIAAALNGPAYLAGIDAGMAASLRRHAGLKFAPRAAAQKAALARILKRLELGQAALAEKQAALEAGRSAQDDAAAQQSRTSLARLVG